MDDILTRLGLDVGARQERVIITATDRPELRFRVEPIPVALPCPQCQQSLLFRDGQAVCPRGHVQRQADRAITSRIDAAKGERLVALLTDPDGLGRRWRVERQRGIIYCAYVRTTMHIADLLRQRIPDLRVGVYHGQLDDATKLATLAGMTAEGEERLDVVVATNAFGMGIDLRHLGFVVHWDVPATLEAYYQEAGRAGRDAAFRAAGQAAECLLLYHPADLEKQRFLRRGRTITAAQLRTAYRYLAQHAHAQGTQAVALVRDQDLVGHLGLDVEQAGMALYYLERHTIVAGESVIRQDELVQHVRWMRLCPDAAAQFAQLPLSPARTLAQHLLAQARLTTEQATLIQADTVAAALGWTGSGVDAALARLQQAGIIQNEPPAWLCWQRTPEQIRADLELVQAALTQCFQEVRTPPKRRAAWEAGRSVSVDLLRAARTVRPALDAVMLGDILVALTRPDGTVPAPLTLARPHHKQVGGFEVCADLGVPLTASIDRWFGELRARLAQVEALPSAPETREVTLDLAALAPSPDARRQLLAGLRWLERLGGITYQQVAPADRLRQIILLHPEAAADDLDCDLSALRTKEAHDAAKPEQMRRYAEEATDAERQAWFAAYFAAAHPLLEERSATWMTAEQRTLLTLTSGQHAMVAPAGTGKTRTLVALARELVVQRRIPPERLLIVTHFRAGAAHLSAWLQAQIPEAGQALHAGTLHAFADGMVQRFWSGLLRPDGQPYFCAAPRLVKHQAKWDRLLEGWLAEALRRWHTGAWTLPDTCWPEGWQRPVPNPAYRASRFVEEDLLAVITRLRDGGIMPAPGLESARLTALLKPFCGRALTPELAYALWMQVLELQGEALCYGFDDQVLFALALLRADPDLARLYQGTYEAILIDEFQDLSPAAAALILALTDERRLLVAVGEPEQDIRFRLKGAMSGYEPFLAHDACGGPHRLAQQFRATQPILDLLLPIRNLKLPPAQRVERLIAQVQASGALPCVHLLPDAPDGAPGWAALAEAAIPLAADLQASGMVSLALIVAKREQLAPVEAVLRRRQIAYHRQEPSVWDLSFLQPVVRWLRLIQEPQDADVAWWLQRALVPYLTREHLQQMQTHAQGKPLWQALRADVILRKAGVSGAQREAIARLLDGVQAFTARSPAHQALDALRGMPDGPLAAVAGDDNREQELEAALGTIHHLSVQQALVEIARVGPGDAMAPDEPFLILSTIDHAKSQEYDGVILLGFDALKHTRRLYVAVSRARSALHLIGHRLGLLEQISSYLYDVRTLVREQVARE